MLWRANAGGARPGLWCTELPCARRVPYPRGSARPIRDLVPGGRGCDCDPPTPEPAGVDLLRGRALPRPGNLHVRVRRVCAADRARHGTGWGRWRSGQRSGPGPLASGCCSPSSPCCFPPAGCPHAGGGRRRGCQPSRSRSSPALLHPRCGHTAASPWSRRAPMSRSGRARLLCCSRRSGSWC
jgi:hypothetical protein